MDIDRRHRFAARFARGARARRAQIQARLRFSAVSNKVLLLDAGVLPRQRTHVVFGSRFENDVASALYRDRCIRRVRSAMENGDVVVLIHADAVRDKPVCVHRPMWWGSCTTRCTTC